MLPSIEDIKQLKQLSNEEAFNIWKVQYSQHCFAYHFNELACERERTCAFLHNDPSFTEDQDVAFG